MEATKRTRSEPPAGVAATRALLRDGHVSAVGHVQALLAAIEDVDAELRAFVAVGAETALREAELVDRRIRERGPDAWRDRPLLGVPVSVKDLIQTQDLPTRRGSLLPNDRPAVDAPLVARLRAAGAIVIGKTSTSEYGWCGSTVSRLGPATGNPWDLALSAGGSSGGAAAAVSAGLCAASIGTDGAGSVRIPAAFCGVVGFKPTFATVPYVPACADRLAHAGPITATVADAAELMAVLAGPHPADPDSALRAAAAGRPAEGASVAWIECPGASPEVRRCCEDVPALLAGLGFRVERIDLPYADPGPALVDLIAAAEAAGTSPDQEDWIDPGRLAVVRYGRTLSGADVARAEDVRMALRTTLAAVMREHDLLAMATLPVAPFGRQEIGPPWAADPADLAWTAWTPATYPFNMTGQPAVSLPVGLDRDGLPVGVQLVGPVGGDDLVLAAAARLEAALGVLPAPPLARTAA